jgi:hypothetical protein
VWRWKIILAFIFLWDRSYSAQVGNRENIAILWGSVEKTSTLKSWLPDRATLSVANHRKFTMNQLKQSDSLLVHMSQMSKRGLAFGHY